MKKIEFVKDSAVKLVDEGNTLVIDALNGLGWAEKKAPIKAKKPKKVEADGDDSNKTN